MKVLYDIKGASVIAVALILAIVTALGVVFVSLFSTGIEESTGELLSTRALYAAESGIETAIGRLKKNPIGTNWEWRDGYMDKPVDGGSFDVEVLEYESRDSTLAGANKCEPFENTIDTSGVNPARTVYIVLSWSSSSDMGVELYDNTVADCSNPAASATLLASSLTTGKPERIRYRITSSPLTPFTYTVRVTGNAGDAYKLSIVHPEEDAFSTANQCGAPAGAPFDECVRALISLGKHSTARREVFAAMSRTP
ncbi:MAG TPA: hypothetical protein DDW94_03180 [Deltaproteobacteria bacterium]|nr:MAG: hypothetical protein A2Z79_09875 [Deltaproteobacteria bacterium GWA2_55_82]OGQ62492.1 MAG: hypothetical protein A3I81_08400 [Deltaproteobacteria bacterium RIFCSPLOWO2_02_FULL_55_12]OIJ73019.1 MAG: hypothetical protein A2V21_301335 [Deltaproteobacteria bacterium GWC2_55_46]HBG45971.1 hypothetical protein [Deltaproteobacteria bacterium]